MPTAEKIRIALIKRDMTIKQLAESIGVTAQNLSNKLARDNLTRKELDKIAEALNCEILMVMKDTGERL